MKIDVNFLMHHKTRKLEKLLGNDGIVSLLKLLTYSETIYPDGTLHGM